MLNRTQFPALKSVKKIVFLEPLNKEVDGNTKLHWIKEGAGEGFKLDFIFDAGTIQTRRIIAKLTGQLLLSGTKEKTASQLNEQIDSLGGFINSEVTAEDASLSLFGLVEHFDDLVEIVVDAIKNVVFPEKELMQSLQSKRQGFLVAQQKVAVRARRTFLSEIYKDTLFGRLTTIEDFDTVNRQEIIDFHSEFYIKGLTKICLIGDVGENSINNLIEKTKIWATINRKYPIYNFKNQGKRFDEDKEGAVQSAIRIGKILFNRKHPDYMCFMVLNTLLGGYFGSRLMSSIREDKGYTYGIGSGLAQSLQSGYFFISTEVGKEVKEDAIQTIRLEIEKLQNELVSEEELSLVRNFSIGELLKASDGPFSMMERYLNTERFGLDLSYYNEVLKTLNTITPKKIQLLAKKHLKWEDMVIVSVG